MYDKQNTIIDRREMLKVKVKSLAAEARIIRREEMKARGDLRCELCHHRRGAVRLSSREAGIAYGYIRGLTLEQMERNANTPGWNALSDMAIDRIAKMVKKYGPVPGYKSPLQDIEAVREVLAATA